MDCLDLILITFFLGYDVVFYGIVFTEFKAQIVQEIVDSLTQSTVSIKKKNQFFQCFVSKAHKTNTCCAPNVYKVAKEIEFSIILKTIQLFLVPEII